LFRYIERMATLTDARYATTLAHGLDVLEAFAGGPLTHQALVRRTGLSKATITRMTTTLAMRGLLEPDAAAGRGYRLGSAALTLGYPLLARLGLRRLARLPMKQMADALSASVSLGMRERGHMVYVETLRSNDPATFQPDLGAPLPLLATAMGRAWLASADDAERQDALQALKLGDPTLPARWADGVSSACRQSARRGFCHALGDWLPDVHAVAVPLRLRLHGTPLVLNCGLAARRLRPGQLLAEVGPRLLQLAAHIEREWASGHGAPSHLTGAHTGRQVATDDPDDGSVARTLARGIDLLLAFGPTDESLGNGEIARRLGLSRQTVVRLTHTLVARGYLRRDPQTHQYRLGAATLAAGYPMLSGLRIRQTARPAMLALAERLGAAVSLGLRHQTGMVYVETAWRTDERLLPPDTGAPMPMLVTAMGRAWLSRADTAQRSALLHRIRLEDPASFERYHRVATQAAQDCRHQGWCSSSDFRPEIVAVAVPFERPIDGVQYVMNCGVLKRRLGAGLRVKDVAAALRETVAAVEGLG
jgi:DNA-binding IclR family transcriptional regulator